MKLTTAGIVVGQRRREDYGDIAALAASIERYGLLHPIVVDGDGTLVAGGRRFEAVKSLGWQSIEVRSLGDLTPAERDEIELEENLQRKDLTAHERSKTLVKLAETAREVLQEQTVFSADSAEKPRSGRPPKPASDDKVAERLGIPRSTIREAQQHVEIAAAIPSLAGPDVKQYHALEAREKLDRLPEPERPLAVALVNQLGVPPKDAIAILGNLAEMPAESRARIFEKAESDDSRDRSDALTDAAQLPPMPDPRIHVLVKVLALLSKAERMFADDPMNASIGEAKDAVEAVRQQLREYRRDVAA